MTSLLLAVLLGAPAQERKGPGWDMDYGPFLSTSVSAAASDKDDQLMAARAISIRVGKDATVCFDTELLRVAAAWTGGFLDLSRTHLSTAKGRVPTRPLGEIRFRTPKGPGWAKGGDFADPRPGGRGPLPKSWAHYRGLYRHRDKVVLSYTVGECSILETFGFRKSEQGWAFSREFRIGPSTESLTLRVATAGEHRVRPVGEWKIRKSGKEEVLAELPPRAEPGRFAIVISSGPGVPAPVAEYPEDFLAGGAPRFKETVTTRGKLGRGFEPYVVDTLTLPSRNPWNSWIRPTALDVFSDGRVAITTWSGDVWIVSGVDRTLERLTWKRHAAGLYEPLGMKIVDDTVYVRGRDQITRLRDFNDDGEADFYENFNNDDIVSPNYHAFAFDLQTDPEGNFYYTRSGIHVPSEVPMHGSMIRVSKDGGRAEVIAKGLRAANGIGVGPGGEITCADNQGHWTPSSRINWVEKGGYYGFVPHAPSEDRKDRPDPPFCWVPMDLDNSGGSQVWVPDDRWGPFKGRMLHTSYGKASLYHVVIDRSKGRPQGGVIRFPLSFASSIMRARFSPADGQLYVTGLRAWQSNAGQTATLQRVRYTGKPVHTVKALRVRRTGIDLVFTNPLDPERAALADYYAAWRWGYRWTSKYGSPDYSVADPERRGRDDVEIKSVRLSEDGKTVSLEIPDMRPAMQMLIKFRVRAADGARVSLEIPLTIHQVPGEGR